MSRQRINYLIIHCTDTPEGRNVTAADIRLWHTGPKKDGHRGWRQVGYTDMIHLDGAIERLADTNDDGYKDPWEVTNGVRGRNHDSRHVVYVGGADAQRKPKDTRTAAQKEALCRYVCDYIKRLPWVKVAGHYHFDSGKACPSFDVEAWLKEIKVPEANIYKR